MSAVDRTVADLKTDEGWSAFPYRDSLGYLTLGYGFLVDERKGGGLPREVGQMWLRFLVENVADDLDRALPWLRNSPEHVQRALLNMAYQMGVEGLLKFRNTLPLIQAGRYDEAADRALQSVWARQTPNRARRVTDMLRGKIQ